MFDEAHKAKNFNSSKEELSTKVSQAVIKIQVISVRVLCMLACFKDAAGRHRDPGDGVFELCHSGPGGGYAARGDGQAVDVGFVMVWS